MDSLHADIELGTHYSGGHEVPFGISNQDRRFPVHVIGKTGSGKSTFLRNVIAHDIDAGRGFAYFDPHGDEASAILDMIPQHRVKDVVYFDPSDRDHPFCFNLLAGVSPENRHLVTSSIVAVFRGMFADAWGHRTEHILYGAVAALLECEGETLMGITRMLSDEEYRRSILNQVRDPAVLDFWMGEFARYDRNFLVGAIAPIQNKVGQFLMAPAVRNVLGQQHRSVSAREIMDGGMIFIANLSKGRIGEDKANLLGSLLVSQFQQAALSRADIREEERRDFHLFVDEVHSFVTESFTTLLSEARKYRVCLVVAHQYLYQLKSSISTAVLGNAGSTFVFRIGQDDAEVFSRAFGNEYPPAHFTVLGNYEVCAKVMQQGKDQPAFTGRTHGPRGRRYGLRDEIIAHSRGRYTEPRHIVEENIAHWYRFGRFPRYEDILGDDWGEL